MEKQGSLGATGLASIARHAGHLTLKLTDRTPERQPSGSLGPVRDKANDPAQGSDKKSPLLTLSSNNNENNQVDSTLNIILIGMGGPDGIARLEIRSFQGWLVRRFAHLLVLCAS